MSDSQLATDWAPTACVLCECNCGVEVKLGGEDGRRFVKVKGDRAHPVSRGYTCEKALRLDYYQNGPDRVLHPLKRRADGSGFDEIGWDQAIAEVAERLGGLRDEHGGASIFYYGGGGQGNHLPGAYSSATRRALGIRYRSNALAQEKTGEFWVASRMIGAYTRSDFEHCEVALFMGKNPWHSHSIPRARVTLKQISKDPNRCLIVIDPRRTETAQLADIHLRVRPGCDAWLVAALVAALIEEDLLDREFLDANAVGVQEVVDALGRVPISEYADRSGVEESLIRQAARRIGEARGGVATMEDLGVQMNRHSTLVSYLHRMLWLLTGNFGRPGTAYVPTPLVSIAGSGPPKDRRTPVTNALIIGGLVPCNSIAEEILTDHPDRFRGAIVEAANPAHSLADSPRMREALSALDTLVVIDVAMTETAQLADYVLPASTQYEKAEATFFNFEFPNNSFHLRAAVLPPPDGPLSEAEIHTRLVEALGGVTDEDLAPLHAAAAEGIEAYGQAFFGTVMPNPKLSVLAPIILYRTLGPTLPEGVREGAVLWGIALQTAMRAPESLARAGFGGHPAASANKLFAAMLDSPSGVVFAIDDWDECLKRIGVPGGKIQLALPDLLQELTKLAEPPDERSAEFPFTLTAGERRSYTANTIIRDPAWRKKGAGGELRLCPTDAAALNLSEGDLVRVATRRGAVVAPVEITDTMLSGHVALPNGMGMPNELTSTEDRDPYAGTPWHKSVPARLEAVGS